MLELIIAIILMFTILPFILGLLLGLIRERVASLSLLFVIYILLVSFWQYGMGTPSGPPTLDKASWFLAFYLMPASIGYLVGYYLSKKNKIQPVELPTASQKEEVKNVETTRVTAKKFCPSCGRQVSYNANYCPGCGRKTRKPKP